MAAVLRNLQLGLKAEAPASSQGATSEEDQARVRGFLQELSQVQTFDGVLWLLVKGYQHPIMLPSSQPSAELWPCAEACRGGCGAAAKCTGPGRQARALASCSRPLRSSKEGKCAALTPATPSAQESTCFSGTSAVSARSGFCGARSSAAPAAAS